MFIFQWQFDEAQMTMDNVGAPVTPQQWNYIHIQGRNIRNTFTTVNAVFSPSCISHTVITKPDWMKVEVAGVNLPDAIQCWVSQTLPGELEPTTDLDVLAADKYVSHERPMMADSPQTSPRYAINSNLVKSLDRPGEDLLLSDDVREGVEAKELKKGLANYPNSMGRRINEVNQNLVDNRTQKQQRHHRTKLRHPRCRFGDTLENRLRCIREENKVFLDNEVAPGSRNNRDLLRSLDGASKRRRKRRRRNRKRQIRLAGMENLTKDERRIRRREEKRRLKELERKRRKARKREEKRRLRELEKMRRSEERRRREEEREERKDREERRRREEGRRSKRELGTCSTKHIDRCSWPQCNRSCPQLHNPLTGIFSILKRSHKKKIFFNGRAIKTGGGG